MNNDWFSVLGANRLIDSVEAFLLEKTSDIPVSFDSMLLICIAITIAALAAGFLLRLFFGKRFLVNRGISGFIGVLFVYYLSAIIYTLRPLNFDQYLSPLPFAFFRNDILIISSSASTTFTLLSSQLLSLIIICFIMHLLSFLLPNGSHFWSWFLLRIVSVILALFLNLTANWALNTFLPGVISSYGPVVLVCVLGAALVVSLFNPLLCILFTVANPIIGILYTFFFSNSIGKNLTRAVLSAAFICLLFYLMEYLGYSVINITGMSLLKYTPFALAFVGVWFVFDNKY